MPGTCLIIPVWNAACWIDSCMAEILAQTRRPDEILFVDDASSDDTIRRIVDWQARSPIPIRLERLSRRSGPGVARNLGMSMASHDYVCFMDVDDGLHVSWLEKLYEAVDTRGADVAVCGMRWVWPEDAASAPSPAIGRSKGTGVKAPPPRDILPPRNADARALLRERPILYATYNKLFRKSWLADKGVRFPACRVGEDMAAMTMCMLENPRVAIVPEALYLYRVNRQSITKDVRARREIFIALDALAVFLERRRHIAPDKDSGSIPLPNLARGLLLAKLLCLHGAWYPARLIGHALTTRQISAGQAMRELSFHAVSSLAFLGKTLWRFARQRNQAREARR